MPATSVALPFADGVAPDGDDDLLKLPTLSRDLRLVVSHDWEQITGAPCHWAPLPRTPCVADLLQTYVATKRQGGIHGQAWRDFGAGLVHYFDEALPRLLLYLLLCELILQLHIACCNSDIQGSLSGASVLLTFHGEQVAKNAFLMQRLHSDRLSCLCNCALVL